MTALEVLGLVVVIPGGIAVLLAAVFYGAMPVVIWRIHRRSPTPEVLPREPGAYPSAADQFFNDVGPRLADLGFGETQRWVFRGFVRAVATEICTMADRKRRVLAWITVVHVQRRGVFRLHSRSVEFVSRREDGKSIGTTNTPDVLPATEVGSRRFFQLPSVQDPSRLLAAHEKLVAREWPGAAPVEPPAVAEIPARLREAIDESSEWQVAQGWLKRRPTGLQDHPLMPTQSAVLPTPNPLFPDPPKPASGLSFTLRGAYRFTWQALWPLKGRLKRRMREEEARLLREVGV